MPVVDYPLGRAEFNNATTVMSASVPIDDADIDPVTGDPDPDAVFQGDIVVTVTGPGFMDVCIWRGADQTKPAWRDSRNQYPAGITAADSTLTFNTGGPVKKLSDISWVITAREH
jgi:hypothetical protein